MIHNEFEVIASGPLTTIQDQGRVGFERFGVPQSGPMDPFAFFAANRLVGNPSEAAGLEFAMDGPTLKADSDGFVAGAGWGWSMMVGGRSVGLWRAARVFGGETIQFVPQDAPGWGYLAVFGGIDTPPVMGSRSTYLRGGFGGLQGRLLTAGDKLPIGAIPPKGWQGKAGRWLVPASRPEYGPDPVIPVLIGPQEWSFTPEALQTFLSSEYQVSATSDRMGYRLSGPKLAHSGSADLISEPMSWGAVQVPADGQPIVMMADRPTTGGYPKIAVVASAGLPVLAQTVIGLGRVRFRAVDLDEARRLLEAQMQALESGIEEVEDGEWTG